GTFPGKGQRSETVGGITYGYRPGQTIGRVGSGFDKGLLHELSRDPAAYIGRIARLRAAEKFPSGALRAPRFLAFHEDYDAGSQDQTRRSLQPSGSPRTGAKSAAHNQQLVEMPLSVRDNNRSQEQFVDAQYDTFLRLFEKGAEKATVDQTRENGNTRLSNL